MLVFPSMLVAPAKNAGMKTPELNSTEDDFDPEEFPHFAVFCVAQLGRPMGSMSEHWENAKVIAGVSEEDIRTANLQFLLDRGLSYAN